MKILLVYFSATGNTGKVAGVIKKKLVELGATVEILDITAYQDRQQQPDLSQYQGCVFGFPVHSHRAPRVVRDWLQTLNGRGMKCAMFFTYGGFTLNPVHDSTREILEAANFVVVSSAEFPGKHTFNLGGFKAMLSRPDEDDFGVAEEYAARTYARLNGTGSGRLGRVDLTDYSDEELDQLEQVRFMAVTQLPTRNGEECGLCGACEELCPAGAINSETGEADGVKCITCFRCLVECPEEALHINDLSQIWPIKLQMENLTEESLKMKKSRIFL